MPMQEMNGNDALINKRRENRFGDKGTEFELSIESATFSACSKPQWLELVHLQ